MMDQTHNPILKMNLKNKMHGLETLGNSFYQYQYMIMILMSISRFSLNQKHLLFSMMRIKESFILKLTKP